MREDSIITRECTYVQVLVICSVSTHKINNRTKCRSNNWSFLKQKCIIKSICNNLWLKNKIWFFFFSNLKVNNNIVILSFSWRQSSFFAVTQQHSTDRKKDNMSQGCGEKASGSWMQTGYANTAATTSLSMPWVVPGLMSSVCLKKK